MADRPLTNIERVRENVAIRVQATSLRAVARQVGMSPTGLEKFLAGGMPYTRSRQKLQDWWEREGSRPVSDITAEGVEIAIGALVRGLPPEHRAPTVSRLVGDLRDAYETSGAVRPPWLAQLCDQWTAGRDPSPVPDADTNAPPDE